jgi:sulfatase maturation enzyme AslB (radical SAM superfamily)
MSCDYCYEKASRDNLPEQIDVSKEDINKFLKEISEREKNQISTIVLMGGEVFLKPNLLKYVFDKMSNMNHKWGSSITTNATLFDNGELINDLYFNKSKNVSLTIEISYDCSGHDRRTFRNGRFTKKVVENSLDLLVKSNIPFKISYTLHKDNYNNFVHDMIYICERWGSHLLNIKVSPFFSELNEYFGENSLEKIGILANAIGKRYKIYICDFNCSVCKKCDRSNFIGNSYLSPNKSIIYEESETQKLFDKW